MQSDQVAALKNLLQSPGWLVLQKEYERKIGEIDEQLDTILSSSSCILDEKHYKEIVMLSYQKHILQTFLKTPLEVINRLEVKIN